MWVMPLQRQIYEVVKNNITFINNDAQEHVMEVADTSHLLRVRSNFIHVYNAPTCDGCGHPSVEIYQAEGDFCCSCWQASTEPYITPAPGQKYRSLALDETRPIIANTIVNFMAMPIDVMFGYH